MTVDSTEDERADWSPCAVCTKPVRRDEAHFLHEEGCTEGCACDRPVHPDCCPEPDCVAVPS